jgi:hypothetical protein
MRGFFVGRDRYRMTQNFMYSHSEPETYAVNTKAKDWMPLMGEIDEF